MKHISVIMIIAFLYGCGSAPTKIEVPPNLITYANKVNCYPPKVSPIEMEVVNPRSIRDAQGNPGVHLSSEDYTKLSQNIVEIRRWMTGIKSVVEYFKTCIDDFNSRVNEFEQQEQPQEEKRSFIDKLMN